MCFTLLCDQECVISMSLQTLICYHLPTRGRAGIKLGMLIRLKRIYNFCLFHAYYMSLPHAFIMFLYHFGMIYGTNLLTRYPVPVPVFCCLFVSEKLVGEVSPNRLKYYGNYFYMETKTAPGGDLQGAPQAPDDPQERSTP